MRERKATSNHSAARIGDACGYIRRQSLQYCHTNMTPMLLLRGCREIRNPSKASRLGVLPQVADAMDAAVRGMLMRMFTAAHQSQVSPPGLDHEASQAARVRKLMHRCDQLGVCSPILAGARACRNVQRLPACRPLVTGKLRQASRVTRR